MSRGVMNRWSTMARCTALVTAALLNASCLDQVNGVVGESGPTILKGFNPTNPHVGDAIIATFFWFGSTNVITAVSDHLTDGTTVGNAYHLVEYVTGNGISMATYVATNVQNFPDPNPTQEKVLVVQADLSSPVPESGIMISSYTGVNAAYPQALAAHRSAAGSATGTMTADPGTISVGAGSLVYAVAMAAGVVSDAPPSGFTNVTRNSDAMMVGDGEYMVATSAGSVDPRWTWNTTGPARWLATVLALTTPARVAGAPVADAVTRSR